MSAASDAIASGRAAGRTSAADTAKDTAKKTAKQARAPRQPAPVVDIVVGAEPRVDLLPAEIRTTRRHEQIVRRMLVGLVITVAVVIAAVLAASMYAVTAQSGAAAEQARGEQLIQQQAAYAPLRQAQAEASLIKAAQAVGGSTDIDWPVVGESWLTALPAGCAITNVQVGAATPLAPYQQSLVPGSPVQVATATITISAPDLPSVTRWLSTLSALPNVVDTTAGAITAQSSGYQAIATVSYGPKAWDGKYLPKSGGK